MSVPRRSVTLLLLVLSTAVYTHALLEPIELLYKRLEPCLERPRSTPVVRVCRQARQVRLCNNG